MKKRQAGFMVFGFLFFILLSFGLSWAQNPTMLIVVRSEIDTLWKMTCDEVGCSPFSSFPGLLRYQPTVTWDEATQEWVVVGTASDNTIWMSTFDNQGNFNNDWHPLPGMTPSPAGLSSSLYKMGGDIKTDRWLNDDSNTFIGVGVVGAGNLAHNSNIEGWNNTAFGYRSLYNNTTGYWNTANGYFALSSNTTGHSNTAYGASALSSNSTGGNNTASGAYALFYNSTGDNNTANGSLVLHYNTTGDDNTASGAYALYRNTEGYDNTASGRQALYSNTTGDDNTAIGYRAGYNATTGNNNIYIGSYVEGSAGESNVIRIGSGQTQTYIAGINGASIGTGSAVYVNSNGQLGTVASSRRFKEDINDMGEASSRLMNLRPVTFRFKNEMEGEDRTLQYGLIAEEVAKVYPELIQYGKDGEPFTVHYHELAPMLLNEVQKLTQALSEKDMRIQRLEKSLEELIERIAVMENPTKTIALK